MLTPAYDFGGQVIYQGDVRAVLKQMDAGSVHTVITSPPFWGLRAYPCEPQIWGGVEGCEHSWQEQRYYTEKTAGESSGAAFSEPGEANAKRLRDGRWREDAICSKCRAWRGHLGLEPDVSSFVDHLVGVFTEVWRVLRDDGTLWLNIGDAYSTGTGRSYPRDYQDGGRYGDEFGNPMPRFNLKDMGLKTKDLLLVPERLAIALQDAGWYVRSRIAWGKLSPMPESIDDRPTSSWEHIYMLAKNKDYFWDSWAVRERATAGHDSGNGYKRLARLTYEGRGQDQSYEPQSSRNLRNVWLLRSEPGSYDFCRHCDSFFQGPERSAIHTEKLPDGSAEKTCPTCGKKDGWLGHYASFPSEIPRRALLAGSSVRGVCGECGAPHERIVERVEAQVVRPRAFAKRGNKDRQDTGRIYIETEPRTMGWRPTCPHIALQPAPATILDPFLGSGTSLLVARQLGRHGIGIELSEDYVRLAAHRLEREPIPMVVDEGVYEIHDLDEKPPEKLLLNGGVVVAETFPLEGF